MVELPIDDQTFRRCQIVMEISDEHHWDTSTMVPLIGNYTPEFRGDFNLQWNHCLDYRDIQGYEQCMTIPAELPYYRQPNPDTQLPSQSPNRVIPQPEYTSLLPLLIAAHHYNINLNQYQVVSERNSLRKISMSDEDYVVGVQKFGPTLFLRRYDHRFVNRNDYGYRFEQMCTSGHDLQANYFQLIEGHVGDLRTLITGETDAVDEQDGQAIELKCLLNGILREQDCNRYWLQAFLGGVTTIKIGHRTDEKIEDIRNVHVANMIHYEEKKKMINRLYEILGFLSGLVQEQQVYLFACHTDPQGRKHRWCLYRVAPQDKQRLTFITQDMYNQLIAKTEGIVRRLPIRRRNRRKKKNHSDDNDNISSSEEAIEEYYENTVMPTLTSNRRKTKSTQRYKDNRRAPMN